MSVRWRAGSRVGVPTPAQGETSSSPREMHQLKNLRTAASTRLAITGAPRPRTVEQGDHVAFADLPQHPVAPEGQHLAAEDAGGLSGCPVLGGMAGEELGDEILDLLGGYAALGSLLLGLRIPTGGPLGQHPLRLHPRLVGRDLAVLADGVLARIAPVAGWSVLDEEHLAPGWRDLEAEALQFVSHQITSLAAEGRGSMVLLVSLRRFMRLPVLATWLGYR